MSTEITQIKQMLQDNPRWITVQIAEALQVSEWEVIQQLPAENWHQLPIEHLDQLIKALPDWGVVLTVLICGDSVFEFKGHFSPGYSAHGYYNLKTERLGMQGHLKLDEITRIVLTSRVYQQYVSHAINFIDNQGNVLFRVYLGRDEQGQHFAHQLEKFMALKAL